MNKQSIAEDDVPVWARSSAFLCKPGSAPYGFIDVKGGEHVAETADELAQKLEVSRLSFDYVWSPEHEHLVVPEQLEIAHLPLRKRQAQNAEIDLSNGLRMGGAFGLALAWSAYAAWKNSGGVLSAVYKSQLVGMAALLLLIFGLIPLYQGWKARRHLRRTSSDCLFLDVKDAQFDMWLRRQKVPVTYFLIGCLAVCTLVQFYLEAGKFSFLDSVLRAGLLKRKALEHPEILDGLAWWRYFTAPMIHGNLVHFFMNASGVLYLGRRTELLARWPHLVTVFLIAMLCGAWASVVWAPEHMAVGASGGLLGLLGFLLVFEILHSHLVPRPAKRRLFAGLLLVIITGFLGVGFIDNAAHLGGLLAGAGYALIVFPPSASFRRPVAIQSDKVIGGLALLCILGSSLLAVVQMLA